MMLSTCKRHHCMEKIRLFSTRIFSLRLITSQIEENFLTSDDSAQESRWLFLPFYFSTIESPTAQPKLKLVQRETLIFDRKLINADREIDCQIDDCVKNHWLRYHKSKASQARMFSRCFVMHDWLTREISDTRSQVTKPNDAKKLQLCVYCFGWAPIAIV